MTCMSYKAAKLMQGVLSRKCNKHGGDGGMQCFEKGCLLQAWGLYDNFSTWLQRSVEVYYKALLIALLESPRRASNAPRRKISRKGLIIIIILTNSSITDLRGNKKFLLKNTKFYWNMVLLSFKVKSIRAFITVAVSTGATCKGASKAKII